MLIILIHPVRSAQQVGLTLYYENNPTTTRPVKPEDI